MPEKLSVPPLGNELWVWVVVDPTGEAGIIGFKGPGEIQMQAVHSKRAVIEMMRPIAVQAAKATGKPVQLRHFASYEVVDEVKP